MRPEDDPLRALLLDQRRVMLSGPVEAAPVNDAAAQLMYLDGVSADPVTLFVNSAGGRLEDVLALVDTLRLMRAEVTIEVTGSAHGAIGAVVASAGGTRRLGATASISLRLDPHADDRPRTAEELQGLADAALEVRRRMAAEIGVRSGQTIDWVLDQFDRGHTLFGADAVAAGLADEHR